MKPSHAFLSAMLLGVSLVGLQGCGQGTYHIPNVPPVVKEKPEEDILGDVDTNSSGADDSSGSKGSDKK